MWSFIIILHGESRLDSNTKAGRIYSNRIWFILIFHIQNWIQTDQLLLQYYSALNKSCIFLGWLFANTHLLHAESVEDRVLIWKLNVPKSSPWVVPETMIARRRRGPNSINKHKHRRSETLRNSIDHSPAGWQLWSLGLGIGAHKYWARTPWSDSGLGQGWSRFH